MSPELIWNELLSSTEKYILLTVALLPRLVIGLLVFYINYQLAKIFQRIISKIITHTINSRSIQILIIKTSYFGMNIFGFILANIIIFPDLQIAQILSALGLGSVALGFAVQDILKNFLAGVILLIQEPFKIGDQIMVQSYEGTVEVINIRYTQIYTFQGERVLLPNSTVFTNPVKVLTAYGQLRTDLQIGVDYQTNLEQATQLLQSVLPTISGVLSNPVPEIDVIKFSDSTIDLMVRYWTLPRDEQLRPVKTQVIIAIKQSFDQAHIKIAYPIQTVYFYNQQHFQDTTPIN